MRGRFPGKRKKRSQQSQHLGFGGWDMEKNWVEIEGFLRYETEMAILLIDDLEKWDSGSGAVWIPKSQIRGGWPEDEFDAEDFVQVEIPEWLAIEKGLV